MKISPSSETYCEKHKTVLKSEIIEKGECCCSKCESCIIRKKQTKPDKSFGVYNGYPHTGISLKGEQL